jgi:hypothetical protein
MDVATAKALELDEMFPLLEFEVGELVRGILADPKSVANLAGKVAKQQLALSLSSEHVQMALLQATINSLATVCVGLGVAWGWSCRYRTDGLSVSLSGRTSAVLGRVVALSLVCVCL